MKALLLTIGALAATLSLAVGLSSASAANSSTVTGTKVAVASYGAGQGPRRRPRPHPLPVREGQARQEQLHREVRWVLAAADRRRQAARGSRGEGLPPRNHEARRRASSGHLQPPSALHIRQGHEARPDKRRGSRRLRRRVVRRHSRRSKGRESRRDEQRRRRLPGSGRLRARVLGVTAHARRGPAAGPLLNRALPLAPPIQLGWATRSVRPLDRRERWASTGRALYVVPRLPPTVRVRGKRRDLAVWSGGGVGLEVVDECEGQLERPPVAVEVGGFDLEPVAPRRGAAGCSRCGRDRSGTGRVCRGGFAGARRVDPAESVGREEAFREVDRCVPGAHRPVAAPHAPAQAGRGDGKPIPGRRNRKRRHLVRLGDHVDCTEDRVGGRVFVRCARG